MEFEILDDCEEALFGEGSFLLRDAEAPDDLDDRFQEALFFPEEENQPG